MKKIFKTTVWEMNGQYHVGDVTDLAHNSNYWYNHCRALGLKGEQFVIALGQKYKASKIHFNRSSNNGKGFLGFSFDEESKAKAYSNAVNRGAIREKIYVG